MECRYINDYHILINNDGEVKLVDRENNEEEASWDLNETYVKISKSDSDFCIAGTIDPGDASVCSTPLEDNTVDINTDFELVNIGGEAIDISNGPAYIELESGTLTFYVDEEIG